MIDPSFIPRPAPFSPKSWGGRQSTLIKRSFLFIHVDRAAPGDATYQDIFQDFTHMASNDPDKLNRYQQYDPQKP
ncbi:hypothetical protein NQZ68_004547 [Dissostichus eleginoides]|nr:hypothetical protein NQZ68_004547 [Dissostichus eleginoides]